MKICSVYNVYDKTKKAVAYIIYYESSESFYIEICEDATFDNLPMMFALYIKEGKYSIDSHWSKQWVCSRIIPTDRQNLGDILKTNNIKYYNEYKLLIKGKGICSHDDFGVEEISCDEIEGNIKDRITKRSIKDVLINEREIIVFFNDDTTRKYDIGEIIDKKEQVSYIISHLNEYKIMPGGYEINWNDVFSIHIEKLRNMGESFNVSYKYFEMFAKKNIVNTAQACEMLNCSRQNIEDTVKRDKLKPVHQSAKNKMFLKSEINEYLW